MSTQRYIVEGPDGKRYVIEGPAQAAPQPQPAPPAAPAQRERAGGYGPFMAGVADAGIKGFLGLKQIFGGLSESDRAVLQQMKEEQESETSKGWRTTGNVAANVALTAVPASKLTKAVQASRALQASRAGAAMAPYLATGAAAGGTEALTAVGSGDTYQDQMIDKLRQAGVAAGTSMALQGVGRAAVKPATGLFRAKPEAERLFKIGINPTLQQGAETGWGRFIGGLSSGTMDIKNRQREEIGQAFLKHVTEGKIDRPQGTGQELLDAAKGYIDDAYTSVWKGKKVDLSPTARRQVFDLVSHTTKDGRRSREAAEALGTMTNALGQSKTNYRMNYDTFLKDVRNKLTDDIFERSQGDTQSRLLAGRDLLDKLVTHKGFTPDELKRLQQVNLRNFDLKRLEEAVRGQSAGKEGLDVNRLAGAYSRMMNEARSMGNTTFDDLVNPAAQLLSTAPTQDLARATRTSVARMAAPLIGTGLIYGATPAALVGSVPIGISMLGQTPKGAKALLGQFESQKALADLLRRTEHLRSPITSGLGVSISEEEE